MKRTVSALAARKSLGELLESVYYRGDEVVVERAGKPMAVIIPVHQYERLERQKGEFLDLLEASWGRRPPASDPVAEEELIAREVMKHRHGDEGR